MAKAKTREVNAYSDGEPNFDEIKAKLQESSQKYEVAADDVDGYWDPEKTPIHCIPIGVKLFDGSIEPSKPAMLVVARLVSPCAVKKKTETGGFELKLAHPGDVVGVWAKPGMKEIRMCRDIKTYIESAGKQDTGKPNPMQKFLVKIPPGTKGESLPILEDRRDKSRHVRTIFDMGSVKSEARDVSSAAPVDDSDIPF